MRGSLSIVAVALSLTAVACLIPVKGAKALVDSRVLPVIYLPPVENIELLSAEEVQRERDLEYAEAVPSEQETAAAEKALAEGYVLCSVKSAGDFHAVIGRLATHEVVPLRLWFYDQDWQLLGEVTGLPQGEKGSYHSYSLDLRPQPGGKRWAVVATLEGERWLSEIGFVGLPELAFISRLQTEGRGDLAWRGDRVLVSLFPGPDQEISVVEIAPDSEAVKVVYQEDLPVAGRAPIGAIVLSPDGRYLALARAPSRPNREYGLWLLDLATGRCQKVLCDETGLLDCVPRRWERPDSLIFTHTTERGSVVKQTWYRAKLKVPMT